MANCEVILCWLEVINTVRYLKIEEIYTAHGLVFVTGHSKILYCPLRIIHFNLYNTFLQSDTKIGNF